MVVVASRARHRGRAPSRLRASWIRGRETDAHLDGDGGPLDEPFLDIPHRRAEPEPKGPTSAGFVGLALTGYRENGRFLVHYSGELAR